MIYRIDLEKIKETIEKVKKNPDEAKRVTKLEGTWNTGEREGSQFEAEVSFEKGTVSLEMTQPTFLGGSGTSPGPMHYCLFGLASCYAATFATIAAMENLHLSGFKIIDKVISKSSNARTLNSFFLMSCLSILTKLLTINV